MSERGQLAHGRLAWLDIVRLLAMVQIIGFHWLRTTQENAAFGLFASPGYENVRRGLGQLRYIITDRSGWSPGAIVNDAIGLLFGCGWEAVNLFVLLSGLGLAMSCNPQRAGFTWLAWYRRRLHRMLLPYYMICFPLILAGEILLHTAGGQPGFAGILAAKLAAKNLPDPLAIELLKHLFLIDPRQPFGIVDFFSPAWWFIPPILFAYVCFPLFFTVLQRWGSPALLAVSLILSVTGYSLTNAGILPEHGWYFVVLHEAMSFSCGIVIGRVLSTPASAQAVLLRGFIGSGWAWPAGAALFVIGNLMNWYASSEPFSTWIFALGLGLLLARAAIFLARLPLATRLVGSIDSYHVYLLHQFMAFPMVVAVAAVAGSAARSVGFSTGLCIYVAAVLATGLGFARLWQWFARVLAPARLSVRGA